MRDSAPGSRCSVTKDKQKWLFKPMNMLNTVLYRFYVLLSQPWVFTLMNQAPPMCFVLGSGPMASTGSQPCCCFHRRTLHVEIWVPRTLSHFAQLLAVHLLLPDWAALTQAKPKHFDIPSFLANAKPFHSLSISCIVMRTYSRESLSIHFQHRSIQKRLCTVDDLEIEQSYPTNCSKVHRLIDWIYSTSPWSTNQFQMNK